VATKTKARFIEPMLLLRTEKLPEGAEWLYELKLDGYRTLAIKSGGQVHLRSRKNNDFSLSYPVIARALAAMPDETVVDGEVVETVVDGEVVALDKHGRPSFNALQNYGSSRAPLHYFIFDVLILKGQDVMSEPLAERRKLLGEQLLPSCQNTSATRHYWNQTSRALLNR
jgi:ATP-dependent DNA ligase